MQRFVLRSNRPKNWRRHALTNSNSNSTEPTVVRLSVEEVPAKPRPKLQAVVHDRTAAGEHVVAASEPDPRLDALASNVEALGRMVVELRSAVVELANRPTPAPVIHAAGNGETLFNTIVAAFGALGYALSSRALLLMTLV